MNKELSIEEFKAKVKRVNEEHKFKVKRKNSFIIRDYYLYYCKHKKRGEHFLTEMQYSKIIGTVNKYLVEELLKSGTIKFPLNMGGISICKIPINTRLVDNKVRTNKWVDWNKTLNLWYEDEQSYKKRTLIRFDTKYRFKVNYDKKYATYNNKSFMNFYPVESLRDLIYDKISKGELDAFLLYDNK